MIPTITRKLHVILEGSENSRAGIHTWAWHMHRICRSLPMSLALLFRSISLANQTPGDLSGDRIIANLCITVVGNIYLCQVHK